MLNPNLRLQKVLAQAGLAASRRKAEVLILEGAVTVNGKLVTELGTKVNPLKDSIKVNGKLIHTETQLLYIAFNKPNGMICALSDPQGRSNLGDVLRHLPARVNPIGRMSISAEGLLLLTNDGELAEKILKSKIIPKTYLIKVRGHPELKDLDRLRIGQIRIEKRLPNKSWIELKTTGSKSLDYKEILSRRGWLVDKIVRTEIKKISVRSIEPGAYLFLGRKDFEKLLDTGSRNAR